MSEGADHLVEVKRRIADAARAAGRNPADVTLVAVSKTHGAERVRELLAAGHRIFGENRVQEAQEKFPALKSDYPDLELHLIGPLQTNKARDAVALFDVIQSVDREKLAATLAKEMARAGRRLPCFVQVNTGEEPQMPSWPPAATSTSCKSSASCAFRPSTRSRRSILPSSPRWRRATALPWSAWA
jgi:PLP dependent protein